MDATLMSIYCCNEHHDDYSIFFNNIKDNVAKRIAAYKANHKQ